MKQFPTNLIHAHILLPWVRTLGAGGAPVEKLFERCGIPLPAVYDPETMITMRQGYLLAEAGGHYAGEETLGLQVGRELQLYELGELGLAVRRAPCIFDAGKVVMAAVHASEPGSQCWIEQHEGEAWFCYRPEMRFDLGGAQAEQFDLAGLLQFIRLAGGPEWLPRKIRVTMAPADVLHQTPEFSEAAIEQSDRMTAIAFPNRLLACPLAGPFGNHETVAGLEDDSAAMCAPRLSSAVSLVLESLFEFEPLPTLEIMGERFGISDRTLQRGLAGEGTSYRHLTERILFRRAASLLGDGELTVKMISAEIGYSSPNSFVRAFRRVAGVTPMAYRKSKIACPA